MTDHENDPHLAEALARRDESRAQILRGKADANPAYEELAKAAEKDARASAQAADGVVEAPIDPEGTAQQLADSEGNFAANAEVAGTGGIGIKASNTDVKSGEPAQTAEQAGVAVTDDAQKITAGDQPVATATKSPADETADTRAAVVIPEGWADLTWQERRSIAAKLSDTPISNGEEANAAIEAELKRRG